MFLSHLDMKVNCAKYYHHIQDFFIAILDPSKPTNSPGSSVNYAPFPHLPKKEWSNALLP